MSEWVVDKSVEERLGFYRIYDADWYFSSRSTVDAAIAGLHTSMPGGSLKSSYGFPASYGDHLVEAAANGLVPFERVKAIVERL